MHTAPSRRRTWIRVSTAVAFLGTIAVITLQIWISVYAPTPLAAVRGIAYLVMCVGIAASGAVVAVFLKLSDSPLFTTAMKILTDSKPALRVVRDDRSTGS